jgi:phosphoribosylaminoimidazolecarboxamide formyltransferase/IMP cyclohydrolase
MIKRAIVSVYDKSGVVEFSKALAELGVEILSTGGTAKTLESNGINVTLIDQYTGHPEILDGRVKTLHPRVHGGILARRSNNDDLAELKANDIPAIDMVVVNLYPFRTAVEQVLKSKNTTQESLIELIDIGGPTMIRAAAKNFEFVIPLCDPADYLPVLEAIKKTGDISYEQRRALAVKVFKTMAAYDAAVAKYFSLEERLLDENGKERILAPVEGIVLEKTEHLRYGENPHQQSALYRPVVSGETKELWHQIQGKELSYNNLLDMQGAIELLLEFLPLGNNLNAAVVIKHSNPSGAAIRPSILEAFKAARACDPVSAFGGIVAITGTLEKEVAECILEGFVEIIVAEKISEQAKVVLQSKKNVRVIECDYEAVKEQIANGQVLIRNVLGQYLMQTADNQIADFSKIEVVAGKVTDEKMLKDMEFSWKVCKHVKSNAIVLVKDQQAIGVGAGQMSRVDSARIALQRAALHGFDVHGAVAASDAFLPFSDTLEVLNDAGVSSLVQPGGSIKDKDVIECAEKRAVTMALTGERHFRH